MSVPPTRVFNDGGLDETFRREGYFVVPLLSAAEVQELLDIHNRLTPDGTKDFFATIQHPDDDHRSQVGVEIDRIIQPRVLPMLEGYKGITSSFICKRGMSSRGKVDIHQDFTFVDQSRCTGVHIWIPLIDVDERNGCLTFYPGTHSLVNHINAVRAHPKSTHPSPYDSVRAQLAQKCGIRTPMKAGSVLFFNERTLHSSEENTTPGERVAVGATYIPEQETMRIYACNPESPDVLDILAIHDPTKLHLAPGQPLPFPYSDPLTHIGSIEYHVEPLTAEQIIPLYNVQSKAVEPEKIVGFSAVDENAQSATNARRSNKSSVLNWLKRIRD
jgi:hypothetical protein